MPSVSIFGGAPSDFGGATKYVVFRETFTGDGSTKTFTLNTTNPPGNVSAWTNGSWAVGQIQTTYPAHVTNTSKQPTYDSTNLITRNRVGISSINGTTGVATLDYAPRSGVSFYIWYWYALRVTDLIEYYREDFIASMEGDISALATAINLDVTNFNGILGSGDTDVQTAFDTVDDHTHTSLTFTNTGLHILDTNASHDLILAPGSDLTADHTLSLVTGDADRTLTLSGNLTVESASLVNQDLTSDASPTFAGATLSGDVNISATSKLYLDAGGDTYIVESAADTLDIYAGGVQFLTCVEVAGQDELVVNQAGADMDFRVEASGLANALFVQGSNGYIGMSAVPKMSLQVGGYGGCIGSIASQINFVGNLYYSSGWKYLTSDAASMLELYAGTVAFHTISSGTADAAATVGAAKLYITNDGSIGIGIASSITGKLHIDQSSTTGAMSVITLDQGDLSEEFIRLIGQSTTDASQSLVDAADLTTPGSIVGWYKIYVQDDQGTNPIPDGIYYQPFYSAPTA